MIVVFGLGYYLVRKRQEQQLEEKRAEAGQLRQEADTSARRAEQAKLQAEEQAERARKEQEAADERRRQAAEIDDVDTDDVDMDDVDTDDDDRDRRTAPGTRTSPSTDSSARNLAGTCQRRRRRCPAGG